MEEQTTQLTPAEAAEDMKAAGDIDPEIKEMLEHAVHFGHRTARQHPKMARYVFGVRNTVSIIDLEQTREKLAEALEYLKGAAEKGKRVLFVDTRPSTREETKKVAEALGMPYICVRWPGGTITNWKTISERIEYLKDLEAKMDSQEIEKYTKKERHDMQEEIRKLNILWGGVKNMTALSDIVFVVDMRENALAVKEARRRGIPVVAIADTNVDPTQADYPIPANDDALSSVKYILHRVEESIKEGGKKK